MLPNYKLLPIVILILLLFFTRKENPTLGYLFDGNNYYQLGSEYLDTLNEGTIEIHFRYSGNSARTLFSATSPSNLTDNFSINIADNRIQYYDRKHSSYVWSSRKLSQNKTYIVSVVYNDSLPSIYINGEPDKNIEIGYQGKIKKIGWFSTILKKGDSNQYFLGTYARKEERKRNFSGYISEVKIYSIPLSYFKINYNIEVNKRHNSTVTHYKFNNLSLFDEIRTFVNYSYVDLAGVSNFTIPLNGEAKNALILKYTSIIILITLTWVLLFRNLTFNLPHNYIKGFDGLRGISVILVIITHLGLLTNLSEFGDAGNRLQYLLSGTTGVNIFFTLSGYLITSILINEKIKTGAIKLISFYKRRFLRLLPAFLILILLVATLMFFNHIEQNWKGIIYSFFYIYNYIPRQFYSSELGITWSLAVEEQFYLIWPVTLILVNSKKKLVMITISVMLLCILFHVIFIKNGPLENIHNALNVGYFNKNYFPARWLIPAVATIMMGSLLAIITNYRNNNLSKVKDKRLILLLGLAIMLCFTFLPKPTLGFGWIIQSIGTCLVIFYIVNNQNSLVVRILENQSLTFIGRISYGLYIYQGLFLGTGPNENGILIQREPLNIILTIIIATLSYFLIEKRALKLKKYI